MDEKFKPQLAFTKSEAGGVGGAFAILVVWGAQQAGVDFTALEGMAISTLTGYLFAFLRSQPMP